MGKEREVNNFQSINEIYGEYVFGIKNMRNYLSEKAYRSLIHTINKGHCLVSDIADEVADAMKTWAVSKGATHFTHWFQPLTGATAEKHEAFIHPDAKGEIILKFSGKELIKGEPDASSFPSGGLRATFEARGYTVWDPTSPAFIKKSDRGATLCIPTAFYSYNGEALDKKTPLLRSMSALSKQVNRLAKLFGMEVGDKRSYTTMGPEQEYFLIDKDLYYKRPDLVQTGRTLFGVSPAKHQQLDDHYFGAVKTRVVNFMDDLDRELWKLGIPAKTRHNEVCPGQFEVSPVFEELNLAVDHNMMIMETLKNTAERHGLICLLHEKPYAGVNGSGKHNNWSICGPDGKNWLSPGDNPHENAKFLTIICALMKAIDTYPEMLRASVATAGNDHRLGANEAPPAILSIFLGEQLTDIIEQVEKGDVNRSTKGKKIEIGVTSLPPLPTDVTDRNRTSPFAFTGNNFEFRAVGSNQSCAGSNIVLNSIVAEALDDICTLVEKDMASGKKMHIALQGVLKNIVQKHRRILFNGDNYTAEWREEAKERGLPNLSTTEEALKYVRSKKVKDLFAGRKVLSEAELISRHDIYKEQYEMQIEIESSVALAMVKTMILPCAIKYQSRLAENVASVGKSGNTNCGVKALLKELSGLIEETFEGIAYLEKARENGVVGNILKSMVELRKPVDEMESLVPVELWPLPSYAEMLFKI